jgi:transcriptional regulator with XRE-family HTH domain
MSRKKSEITDGFSDRLSELMNEAGFGDRKQARFAEAIGVSPSFLSDVLNKKSGPSYRMIYGIANIYTNVNVIWLMTGVGEMFLNSISESTQDSTTSLDISILGQVIEKIEAHSEKTKKKLTPKLKTRLIMLLYEYFSKTGESVEEEKVASYLMLIE